jgi:hypothetical protein
MLSFRKSLSFLILLATVIFPVMLHSAEVQQSLTYRIVHTGVVTFYDNTSVIPSPKRGDTFFAQDAQFRRNPPSYSDNHDGTITDNVTGLMWQKSMGEKMTFEEAFRRAGESKVGGYRDWRVPTIKELYSLILFTGRVERQQSITLFIDTRYFEQPLGDPRLGEREIDAQTWSSTEYTGRTLRNDEAIFGVNFIDGRIKGYPKDHPPTGQPNKMYFRLVRGNREYGKNRFVDNRNGTISDLATGLMWQKADSGRGMDWEAALRFAANLVLAGYNDWRLPNAKELQSIVDYSRSPQVTASAALAPLFEITTVQDPLGRKQYPYFWTSTTHLDGRDPYSSAVYIAFGAALGYMHGQLMDVHGAGAQRSDPKIGNPEEYPQYRGPQGDLRNVYNYVRCVRTIAP